MPGLYIYCVGKKGQGWSRMQHFSIPITGRSVDLEVVPYKDVEAIVESIQLKEFEGDALRKNLENEQWLKEKALNHEQVVEEVMRRTPPIVPFKFGTIFRSRGKLAAMLKNHYPRFQLLLKHFQGRQEWGVKLFSNINRLVSAIRCINPDTKKMKGQPAGKKYFLEKEFEAQLKEKAEESQQARADDFVRQLSLLYEQCVHNPVLSQTLTGKGEEMILNAAMLVKEKQVTAVQQCVAIWNRSHRKEGFLAELTGPWPPYNFVKL